MGFLSESGFKHFMYKLKFIIGGANGLAPLDSDAKVPVENLPTLVGATSSISGSAGIVQAPVAGNTDSFLRSDGVWIKLPIVYTPSDQELSPSSQPEGTIWLKQKSSS